MVQFNPNDRVSTTEGMIVTVNNGNLAIFKNGGGNVARIDNSGASYF